MKRAARPAAPAPRPRLRSRWRTLVTITVLVGAAYFAAYGALRASRIFVHHESLFIALVMGYSHAVYSDSRALNLAFYPLLYLETCWHNRRFVTRFG